MVRLPKQQTTFQAGRLDPEFFAREDVTAFFQGAAEALNVRQLRHGGLTRRFGTLYKADLDDGGVLLAGFEFNENENYLLVFSDQRLDIFDVATVTLIQTITSMKWTAAMLPALSVDAQDGDTMLICHKDLSPTQQLRRTAIDTFTVSDFIFETDPSGHPIFQPYFKFAPQSVTLTPSATTGSITLTTSAAYFVTADVGTVIRHKKKEMTITAFSDDMNVTATVNETLTDTTATTDWDHQAFSVANGWPRTATFHDQRTYFAGTEDIPNGIFTSKIGKFANFDVGTAQADESIQFLIKDKKERHEIRHFGVLKDLQIFTNNGHFYAPSTAATPLAPESFRTPKQSPYGISDVRPIELDDATVYIQRNGLIARETLYDDTQNKFITGDISLIGGQVVNKPVDMASLTSSPDFPEQYAIVVNSDGTLAIFHSIRSEEIAGWTLHDTDGKFKSVAYVGDKLFFAVERTIDGQTKVFLEQAYLTATVDAALELTAGTPTDTWAGLQHLEGKQVYGVDGETVYGPATVTGGSVTFSEETDSIIIGLNYTPLIRTMPINTVVGRTNVAGRKKRIVETHVILDNSRRILVNGTALLVREITDPAETSPKAEKGLHSFRSFGWSENAQIEITQDLPLPFTVLGVSLDVEVS